MMKSQRSTSRTLGIALAATSVLGIALWGSAQAQQDPQPAQQPADTQPQNGHLRVGTLQPMVAFQQWDGREEVMAQAQQLQAQMQQAQQNQDQAQMIDLQTRMQEMQADVLTRFEQDLKRVLPDVARKAGVKVIALNIAYVADDVQTQDVTPDVIVEFGGDPDAIQLQPTAPEVQVP